MRETLLFLPTNRKHETFSHIEHERERFHFNWSVHTKWAASHMFWTCTQGMGWSRSDPRASKSKDFPQGSEPSRTHFRNTKTHLNLNSDHIKHRLPGSEKHQSKQEEKMNPEMEEWDRTYSTPRPSFTRSKRRTGLTHSEHLANAVLPLANLPSGQSLDLLEMASLPD